MIDFATFSDEIDVISKRWLDSSFADTLTRSLLPKRAYHTPVAITWSYGSVLDHISLPTVFESRRGNIWRVFHLWLRFITFGGRSAHLVYHVHKSDRKTSINQSSSSSSLYRDHDFWPDIQGQDGSELRYQEPDLGSNPTDTVICEISLLIISNH